MLKNANDLFQDTVSSPLPMKELNKIVCRDSAIWTKKKEMSLIYGARIINEVTVTMKDRTK
jgi:hypothetical protein